MPKSKKTSRARAAPAVVEKRPAEPVAVNLLIESLPRAERARLIAVSTRVDLVLGNILYEAGARLRYAYFPLDGFISLLSTIDPDPRERLELGLIGHEGMHGASLALGVTESNNRALIQGSGQALRISAAALRRELQRSSALKRMLDRYVYVLMTQQAQAAVCIGFHHIEQRLARWLLMTHDRAATDTFRITHIFLANMLGVRRVGVTQAAGALHKKGLIRYARGLVTITDRRGLEAAACGCYDLDLETWAQWMS